MNREQISLRNENYGKKIRAIFDNPLVMNLMPLIGFLIVLVVFTILTKGKIIQPTNINLILGQVYVLMIAATGVFMIMTVGGIDFSQGSILGFSSIIISWVSHYNIVLAVICGILGGAVMGAVNGFFHVRFRIASFIVTICTMYLFRGLCEYITTTGPVAASVGVVVLNKHG